MRELIRQAVHGIQMYSLVGVWECLLSSNRSQACQSYSELKM